MRLLEENSGALVKLCMIKLMFDHILLQGDMATFNVSILQALMTTTNNMSCQIQHLENAGYGENAMTRVLKKVCCLVKIRTFW